MQEAIKLLEPYKGFNAGAVVSVDRAIALILIKNKKAVYPADNDFLMQPDFNSQTKAFKKSPRLS
jgi:hypothetical protein